MADVSATLAQWSTTASSNLPADATSVGSGLGDNIRTLQSVVRAYLAHYNAVAIASATTTDLGAVTGLCQDVSGTATITGLGTVSAGIWKIVRFTGAATITHNATSLIMPAGRSITAAAGDFMLAYSKGSGNWVVPFYQKQNGVSPAFIAELATETVSDQGDFIPFYDMSAADNRKFTITDMLTALNTLTTDSAPVATSDFLLTYDTSASTVKKALLSAFAATTSVTGVSELATAAEVFTGTDATRTITPSTFAGNKSLVNPGYYRFPGGFTIQFGSATFAGSTTVTFALTFSAMLGIATGLDAGIAGASVRSVSVGSTSFTAIIDGGATETMYYIAVGVT